MEIRNQPIQSVVGRELDDQPGINSKKNRSDLMVLRYMAHRLQTTLQLQDIASAFVPATRYYLRERYERVHRVVLYKPPEAFLLKDPLFVGFVSQKQKHLSSTLLNNVSEVDMQLLSELVHNPGLLSYSSLQLRHGDWFNLVIFSDEAAKKHIKNSHTHAYAAHQLSPHYYEWIRLHQGIIAGGLVTGDFVLQKTAYYAFRDTAPSPLFRQVTYNA